MKYLVALLASIFLTVSASAQLKQSGTVTSGHVPYWVTSGVLGDGGTSLDSPITSIGATASNSAGICANSARVSSGAWQSMCLGFIGGIPTIATQNHGSAPAQNLQFSVNGTTIQVPTGGQNFVFGNGPYTTGNVPCFFNTSGVLQDCGLALSSGTVTSGIWQGTSVAVGFGGTGASTAAQARTNLGLGTMATQNASAVAVTGGTITGMGTPANPTDVANKSYVDATASGLTIIPASTLATAAVLPNTPTYNNGAATLTAGSNTTLTVDGTAAPINTVVLVKNQASTFQNGIYSVTTAGSGSVPWVLTRVSYFNSSANMLKGSFTFITSGATNTNTGWALAANVVVVGTDPATFNQFSNSSPGVVSIGGISGVVTCGTGVVCSGSSVSSGGIVVANVKTDYGAVGDCAADDTTAVQNAVNAAAAAGGQGMVYFPPVASGKCYLIGAINATNKSNITMFGNGDDSLIKVHGSSTTNHIWWDQSGVGCVNVTWRDLKITDDGSTVPAYLFLTGATNTGLNTISCIRYERVNMSAKTTGGLFYGYGLANSGGYSGWSCRDSTWIQTNNGGVNANPSLRNAVLVLDGINSRAVASDYVTLTALHPGSDGNLSLNCNYTDWPSGFGAGVQDNNTAVVLVTNGQDTFTNGSFQCTCSTPLVGWTNNEGISLINNVIQAPDGSVTITFMSDWGGGQNGSIVFSGTFFSVPKAGGCFICFDAPVGGVGGVLQLTVQSPDVGGNPFSDYFILDNGGCAGFAGASIWIGQSVLMTPSGANNIASCGSINHTIWLNPGSFAGAGGAVDGSLHI